MPSTVRFPVIVNAPPTVASFVIVRAFETVAVVAVNVVDVNVVTTPVTPYKVPDASTLAASKLEAVTIPLNVAEVPLVIIKHYFGKMLVDVGREAFLIE